MRMTAISDARDEASALPQSPRIEAPGNAFVAVSLMPQMPVVRVFPALGTAFAMSLAEARFVPWRDGRCADSGRRHAASSTARAAAGNARRSGRAWRVRKFRREARAVPGRARLAGHGLLPARR